MPLSFQQLCAIAGAVVLGVSGLCLGFGVSRWVAAIAAALVALLVGAFLAELKGAAVGVLGGALIGALLGAAPVAMIIGALVGWYAGSAASFAAEWLSHRGPQQDLRFSHQLITDRLEVLAERRQRICQLALRLESTNGPAGDRGRQVLELSRSAVAAQVASYGAKLWTIELLWWANSLEPLRGCIEPTHRDLDQRLEQVVERIHQGAQMLALWEADPLAGTAVGADCVSRLREAVHAADSLKQSLLLQQVSLVAHDTESAEVLVGMAQPDFSSALVRIETLVTHGLTELNLSLEQLESEHERLVVETAAAEEVERAMF